MISRINLNTFSLSYFKYFLFFFKSNIYYNKFFNLIKSIINSKNIIITSKGRVALYEILIHLINVSNKKTFILSPYTLPEVINTIRYAGGNFYFIDINIKTGLPDINLLKESVKANNDIAGVIITHLYSNEENIREILEFLKNNNIKVIEDAAINFDSKVSFSNKKVGCLSDFGFYSFGIMKTICCMNGGMIYAKNDDDFQNIKKSTSKKIPFSIYESLKLVTLSLLINFLFSKYIFRNFTTYLIKLLNNWKLSFFERISYPGLYPKISKSLPNYYKFDFFHLFSVFGIKCINNLSSYKETRKYLIQNYNKQLHSSLLLFNSKNLENFNFIEYPILLSKITGKEMSSILNKNGFDVRHTWYVSCNRIFAKKISFPNSENLEKYCITLPLHKNIDIEYILKISKIINQYNS
tara:strand:+ start:11236 stop:12465 length:1230 start_codon:yes stop_codon:yes gene_type:complete